MSFDGSSGGEQKLDPKVTQFVQQMQVQQQVLEQVDKATEVCWDLCNFSMKDRLDGRAETCLTNCTARYFDVQEYIAQKYVQRIQQAQAGSNSFM